MKRNVKTIIIFILLVTLVASTLLTLSGCSLILLASIRTFNVVVGGVHLSVNIDNKEATVYYFDADETLEEGEMQVCVIPETVTFRKKEYPVTAITDYTGSELVPNIINGDAQIGELVVPKTVSWIDLYDYQDVDTLQRITVDEDNPYYYSKDGVLFRRYDFGDELDYYPHGKKAYSFMFPERFRNVDYMSGLWDNQYVQYFGLEPGNSEYMAIGGALYSSDGEELMLYPTHKEDETFIAPKGMRRINLYSHFCDNEYVKQVEVEEDSLYLKVVENTLCSKDGSELVYRPNSSNVFAIPSDVKVVHCNVLNGVDYLYVPDSVVVFLDTFVGNSYYICNIGHIYFESEVLPKYLHDVYFWGTQLRFNVTRESFDALEGLV